MSHRFLERIRSFNFLRDDASQRSAGFPRPDSATIPQQDLPQNMRDQPVADPLAEMQDPSRVPTAPGLEMASGPIHTTDSNQPLLHETRAESSNIAGDPGPRVTSSLEGEAETRQRSLSQKERILQDSTVVVDLKTNIVVDDEFKLLTELAAHIAERYCRPQSSVAISMTHSLCILFGASMEGAYILSINALPCQVLPTTNKRNAALIQTFMADCLGVEAARGVIKFGPIPEACLATNSETVLTEVERVSKPAVEKQGFLTRFTSRRGRSRSASNIRKLQPNPSRSPSPIVKFPSVEDPPPARPEKVDRRKSLKALWRRSMAR